MRIRWLTLPALVVASGLLLSAAEGDCSFLSNPEEFMVDSERIYTKRSDLTARVSTFVFAATAADAATNRNLDPGVVPRKNFIDEHIFGRMAGAGIQAAPIASDAEFLRRVTLDLTGRIPSAADVQAFLADTNPSKRDTRIDALLGTPEFVDKWTMFFGDLFKVNGPATNVNRELQGRDAFYRYIKEALTENRPYDQIARELITATGDSFASGAPNWPVGNTVPMGPAQDTYDGHAANVASMFLGINAVDCLLCHDGGRHLDQVNLWGAGETRQRMWGLSAYFARTRMQRQVVSQNPIVAKWIVTDAAVGDYNLNTTTGNRSARQPMNGVRVLTPSNPFATRPSGPGQSASGVQTGENYRQALARQITNDIQFSRAAVNYVWEKFMVEAFVTPSNAFDLARLDANNPPPEPWTLQPTNPQLLDALARWFQGNRHDLRALMGLIAKSNAYQLSAVYPGEWNISYVPYYARKYVRRLDAEELHDAIAMATGLPGNYTLNNSTLPPIQWAMQLPDTREPRNNVAATFMNSFGRGDRDTSVRRSDGSVLQALNLMNNQFVMTRIDPNTQGSRVQTLLSQNANAQTIIEQLFLSTLSRPPTTQEIALFTQVFQQQNLRAATESLQWVLLNKMDFLFNY
jgi:hypothetical protein